MPIDVIPFRRPTAVETNRLAQRFYEASGLNISHTSKPQVVDGLNAVFDVIFPGTPKPTEPTPARWHVEPFSEGPGFMLALRAEPSTTTATVTAAATIAVDPRIYAREDFARAEAEARNAKIDEATFETADEEPAGPKPKPVSIREVVIELVDERIDAKLAELKTDRDEANETAPERDLSRPFERFYKGDLFYPKTRQLAVRHNPRVVLLFTGYANERLVGTTLTAAEAYDLGHELIARSFAVQSTPTESETSE